MLPTLPDRRAADRQRPTSRSIRRPGDRTPVRAAMLKHTQLFNLTGHPAISLPLRAAGPARRPAARRPARQTPPASWRSRRLARRSSVRRSSDAMPKHVSVTEAHALQQQGGTYVDVRSTPEFADGHPAGAAQRAAARARRRHRPDAAESGLRPRDEGGVPAGRDAARSAARSAAASMRAAQMLESFGFTDVTNVRGGFGGARDPMGRVVDPGWADSGLPVGHGQRRGRAVSARCSPRPTTRRDRVALPRLGTPSRVGRHQPRRPAVRVGTRLARPRSVRRSPSATGRLGRAHVMRDTDAFFRDAADGPSTSATATGSTFPSAHRDAASRRTTSCASRVFPRRTTSRAGHGAPWSCCRSGTPTRRATSASARSSRASASRRCA